MSLSSDFSQSTLHVPVFLNESIDSLIHNPSGIYVDATFGRGGHSIAIKKKAPLSQLWICDRDLSALEAPQAECTPLEQRLHCNYSEIDQHIPAESCDGILADLGICSAQLDDPRRGFSFLHNGPLDMRMDQSSSFSLSTLLQKTDSESLANIIYKYGEEKRSRPIAKMILERFKSGSLRTTLDLVECITKYVPWMKGEKHPATRTFQALRIAVNHEYEHLIEFLHRAPLLLKPNGILAVISFHSLEYEWIKEAYRDQLRTLTYAQHGFELKRMQHPLTPSHQEMEINPRSRSARLHLYQKKSLESSR